MSLNIVDTIKCLTVRPGEKDVLKGGLFFICDFFEFVLTIVKAASVVAL